MTWNTPETQWKCIVGGKEKMSPSSQIVIFSNKFVEYILTIKGDNYDR